MGNIFSICATFGKAPNNSFMKKTEVSMEEVNDSDKWINHFNIQAKSLQKKHLWAKKMMTKLKNFKCTTSRRLYLVPISTITQKYNILTQENRNSNVNNEGEEIKSKNFLFSYENNSVVSLFARKPEEGFNFYKEISNIIEQQLKEIHKHQLAYLFNEFIEWFYATYKSVLITQHHKGLERKALEKSYKTSIENLQQFIRVFVEILMIYYQIEKISNNGKLSAFSKENFINFITSLLFSQDKIYQIVFFMQKAFDQNFEQKFQLILSLRDKFDISDYLIPDKLYKFQDSKLKKSEKSKKMISQNDLTFFSFTSDFETPNRTVCYQDNFKHPNEFESFHSFQQEQISVDVFNSFDEKANQSKPILARTFSPMNFDDYLRKSKEEKNGDMNPVEEKNRQNYHYKRKMKFQSIKKQASDDQILTTLNVGFLPLDKNKPYFESIKILEELEEIRSPIHKMKKILTMVTEILRSISSLSDSGTEPDFIDQKYLFCIMLYIVSQSKCNDLHTHLKMVEKFSTNNILSSMSGYYLTLLQLIVKFIENLDADSLLGDYKKEYLKDRIQEILLDLKTSLFV